MRLNVFNFPEREEIAVSYSKENPSYILPAVISASLLLSGCGEDGGDVVPPPPPITVTIPSNNPSPTPSETPTPSTTIPIPIVTPPRATAAPAPPVIESKIAAKNDFFMAGAITSNSEQNFNIVPNDPNTPSYMNKYVGTDWLIDQFKGANLNSVVLHFNYNLNTITDTFSRPTFNTPDLFLGAPTWESIEAGAERVVNAGLKPIFYMTVFSLPDSWNSLLADKYVPKDPDAFFASYKDALINVAKLSEKYDSPYLNIGTELGPVATDSKYLPYWEDIISSVRQIYHGKLTYSSYVDDRNNYWTELTSVTFRDKLDMLGMNIYPQTLDNGELSGTYDQFYNEWKTNIVPSLNKLIDELNMPVFISEFGISRVDGAGSTALWGTDTGRNIDYQEQADVFDAALRAIHEGLNIDGIVFWGASDDSSISNGTIDPNGSYTNNWVETPSESIIQKWADIFLPDISTSGGGGGGGGYPSIDTPAPVPVKNWYDEFNPNQGPVL